MVCSSRGGSVAVMGDGGDQRVAGADARVLVRRPSTGHVQLVAALVITEPAGVWTETAPASRQVRDQARVTLSDDDP